MLGPHVIGAPESLQGFLERSQATVIKYLDPDKPVVLAPVTVGRVHALSEEKDLADPLGLARRHADMLSQRAEATGITLWEGINEPPVWNGQDYINRLVDYELERCRLLAVRGLGAVVLNLGVGWPGELPDRTIVWEPFWGLLEDLPFGCYLGLHEYWLPTGPLHPDSLHHRAGRFMRCPFQVPILITECGVDIGGGQRDGWRAQGLTHTEYAGQLRDYRDILLGDPRVKGATVFCYGSVGQWQAFDIEPDRQVFVEVMKPVAGDHDHIRVKMGSGEVVALPLEEYLRGVVPAEMPALWEPEALRAQAIAARSYTLWRMEHPRDADFHLYGDTRDQVYNPAMAHANSDRAVKETAEVYLKLEDQPYPARYVSKCGRTDCSYCTGPANGHDGKSWPGRLCQYGTQAMALRGSKHRDILRHYYPEGIAFSDQTTTEESTVSKIELIKDHNTDAFRLEDGKVVASRVDILQAEDSWAKLSGSSPLVRGDTVYRVVDVGFDNEEQADGDTRILVTVLDENGQVTKAKVVHAWPQQHMQGRSAYSMNMWDEHVFDWATPGHAAEFAQGQGNYMPDKDGPLGPYVIFVEQDKYGDPVPSDWLVGFGLPGNRHVRYRVTYRECTAYVDDVYATETPDTEPEPDPVVPEPPVDLPEEIRPWWEAFARLANSSKAQMGFIVIAAALALYLTDQITADVFMKVLLAIAGLYAGSTAIEDASLNLGGEK